MRVFVVEFGCSGLSGHRCNGVRALTKALMARGIDAVAGVNTTAGEDILCDFNAKRAFRPSPWPPFSTDPICGPIETFLENGETGLEDMSSFLAEAGAGDMVILYTASENEILALANWMMRQPSGSRPVIVVNVVLPHFFNTGTGHISLRGRLLRAAIRRLNQSVTPDRCLYVTLTDHMAEKLTSITDVEFLVSPNPISLPAFAADSAGEVRDGTVRIAAPGQPKGSKGAHIIPRIVTATGGTNMRFMVQNWPPKAAVPDTVEVLPTGLSRADYFAMIRSCDITLLPYDAGFYRYAVSAVFEEAASAGHAIVTSNDTWMADQLDDGLVEGSHLPRDDTDGFAQALITLSSRITDIRKSAAARGAAWREGRGVDGYLDLVLSRLRSR